jgi:hypothetical protein
MRLLPPQIPRDDPEVFDEGLQVRRRFIACESEALGGEGGIEHTLGLRRDLLSEIFKVRAVTRAIVRRTRLSVGRSVRRKLR